MNDIPLQNPSDANMKPSQAAEIRGALIAAGRILLATKMQCLGKIKPFDDKPEAFKNFIDKSKLAAKNTVERFGVHSPTLLLIGNEGDLTYAEVGAFFETQMSKQVFSHILSDMIVNTPTYGLLLVSEGWRTVIKTGDPLEDKLLDGSQKISDLPDDDKQEGLSLSFETCEGFAGSTFIPYVRSLDAVIAFGDEEIQGGIDNADSEGSMQGFWKRGKQIAFGSTLN